MESSPEVSKRLEELRRKAPADRRESWCRATLGDKEVVFLCGTLGADFDRWQRRLSTLSSADAYLSQRVGLEEIEAVMDKLEEKVGRLLAEEGKRLLPRRSPGYGDLGIELNREIVARTDATRKIGVSVTENDMLVPSKSVTAVCEISGNW